MKVLSIDVGIKNLACCLFSIDGGENVSIHRWDVLNIMTEPGGGNTNIGDTAAAVPIEPKARRCNYIIKRTKKSPGCLCNKPATYMTAGEQEHYRCTQHAKKESGYIMPVAELTPRAIAKCNMTQLCELAAKYQIAYTKPIKKAALAAVISAYADATCFIAIGSAAAGAAATSKKKRAPADANAQKVCMIKLGRNLKQHLDAFIGGEFVDHVAIEKQMTARMKCIQSMIAQYFIMISPATTVAFVSATHKLEAGDTAKATAAAGAAAKEDGAIDTFIESSDDESDDAESIASADDMADVCVEDIIRKMKQRTYKTRKSTGVAYCEADLAEVVDGAAHADFLKSHKKQDDLADCYLQGRWYIRCRICCHGDSKS